LMNEEKLKLKSDKKRKAEQALNGILERDSLANIYTRCADVAMRERQILNSTKMEEIKQDLSVFQEQIQQLKATKTRIEAHEAVKEQAYKDVAGRIDSHKKAIEKNVYSSLGKRVQIL
jgi:hypothetical protein